MIHQGFTLWFTGLSGAGKSTLANELMRRFSAQCARAELLDGDFIRTHLSKGLGFSREDRDTNIRRIGFVAELLSRNSVIAVVAAISPYRATRDEVKSRIANFVEVYVDCPLEVLTARDPKGLYRRALSGDLPNFTGVTDPYEPPLAPDLTIYTHLESVEAAATRIWAELLRRQLITE
jgi:adenylyl-sulfate kinase